MIVFPDDRIKTFIALPSQRPFNREKAFGVRMALS
jgi:hypothetical protein